MFTQKLRSAIFLLCYLQYYHTFIHSYFEKNKLKSAEVWKGIRSLVNIKASRSFSIKLLNENNNLISDPKIISNVFNDYFNWS